MTQPQLFRDWHLDKRVPISLIVAILLQTATVIWWGSSLTERVNTLEAQLSGTQDIRERLVRIETILERLERRDVPQ